MKKKYKYSRKQILRQVAYFQRKGCFHVTQAKIIMDMLSATVPVKKCVHVWSFSRNSTKCTLCGVKAPPTKECEHKGKLATIKDVKRTVCMDCGKSFSTPPQLPKIEKLNLDYDEGWENCMARIETKLSELIDRVNLLSQRVCKEK